jgi:hypothetical protein
LWKIEGGTNKNWKSDMLPRSLLAPRRGRPPKFGRPAQPVTLTLPDDIVSALRTIDADLGRAIVRLVEPRAAGLVAHPPAELSYHRRSAVIVVKPCRTLARLPGVDLVPLPDGRALISLDRATGIADLEVMVRDAIDAGAAPEADMAVLWAVGEILRTARRSRAIRLRERNIIVLETEGHMSGRSRSHATRGGNTT